MRALQSHVLNTAETWRPSCDEIRRPSLDLPPRCSTHEPTSRSTLSLGRLEGNPAAARTLLEVLQVIGSKAKERDGQPSPPELVGSPGKRRRSLRH